MIWRYHVAYWSNQSRISTYEKFDEVKVAAGGGRMQWRPVLAIRGIHIRSELHQNLCTVGYSDYKVF